MKIMEIWGRRSLTVDRKEWKKTIEKAKTDLTLDCDAEKLINE